VSNDLKVSQLPVNDLKPYPNNARTHSKKHIEQLADSIRTFGFTNPILVDGECMVIAGHGRLEAAKLLGLKQVPIIRLADLDEEKIRAYILADNRLAEIAGWDNEILAGELQYLLELDLDFNIGVIGFETAEIDLLIESVGKDDDPTEDELDSDPDAPIVSRFGDLWRLGEHQVLCGNALEMSSFKQLIGKDKARIVFTDPPYNVPINGHVGGLGNIQHAEFAMASGEMSEDEFIAFLTTTLGHLADSCVDGALLYICMDWRHIWELLNAGRNINLSQLNLCIWNKNNGGMGSMYRSKHELVSVFKIGNASHINNIELGRYGRYRTNVWDYPGVNTFRKGRMEELKLHPTVKPIALVEDAILDASLRGDIILDCFGGAGTTLLAAERVGRKARLIELEPHYVDITLRRWETATGKQAVHDESGLSFADIETQRLSHPPTSSSAPETDVKETTHG
jgi:DNA modification methylase